MSNPIQQLKKQAIQKRDDAIEAAKQEYAETIQKIGELDSRLTGRRKRKSSRRSKPRLVDLIFDNLPDDRAFSQSDVAGILDAHSERKYAKNSINMTISRMLKAGDIKRVRFASNNKPALYALPHVNVECDKTMIQWAMEIPGWEDLKPVEIMVKMTENGYEMEVSPPEAVRSLKRELKKVRINKNLSEKVV